MARSPACVFLGALFALGHIAGALLLISSMDPKKSSKSVDYGGVVSFDIVIDPAKWIWVRVFHNQRPQHEEQHKRPLIVFTHGGGFINSSPDSLPYRRICSRISKELGAIVVSVNYRLAPRNRLPAAFDDSFQVLEWLHSMAASSNGTTRNLCPWLQDADLTKVFFVGDSAGANIVHQLTARSCSQDLSPLKLAGQVLIQPFFGGEKRTESELKFATGFGFTLDASDFCWRSSLPEGTDRDHPLCNVPLHLQDELLEFYPKSLVVVGGRDLLQDRDLQYVHVLEAAGQDVKLLRYENAEHGFLTSEREAPEDVSRHFFGQLADFVR